MFFKPAFHVTVVSQLNLQDNKDTFVKFFFCSDLCQDGSKDNGIKQSQLKLFLALVSKRVVFHACKQYEPRGYILPSNCFCPITVRYPGSFPTFYSYAIIHVNQQQDIEKKQWTIANA